MSERDRRSDAGFTLPELLITVAVFGLVVVVLAAAITVVLRNHAAADGRLNVARGEQSIDTWMPADLASVNLAAKPAADPGDPPDPYGLMTGYDPVDQATASTPCGGGWPCPGGLDLTGSPTSTVSTNSGGSPARDPSPARPAAPPRSCSTACRQTGT
jgi:prepilin-type N-terminal cleavage/methylation domain-containing protein